MDTGGDARTAAPAERASADAATDALADRLLAGERRALARAITLIESTRADHRAQAHRLLDRIAQGGEAGPGGALRLGLTGTPGVGKSSFIERFGLMLADAGEKVAVLAVDPTSTRSGGSILGDKTRMERLARHPGAFIRPSPSGTALGGVGRRTREAILVAEAAGFRWVLVETVGVGQSETLVAELTDVFVLLIAPGGGDELQGVKRGIMEIADLVVVNKADGALEAAARATMSDYQGALRLMRRRPGDPDGVPTAMTASAATGAGLAEVRDAVTRLDQWRREAGWRDKRRGAQAVSAFERALGEGLVAAAARDPRMSAALGPARAAVSAQTVLPEVAAEQLIAQFLSGK